MKEVSVNLNKKLENLNWTREIQNYGNFIHRTLIG